MIMSTCGTGSVTSSTLPLINVITVAVAHRARVHEAHTVLLTARVRAGHSLGRTVLVPVGLHDQPRLVNDGRALDLHGDARAVRSRRACARQAGGAHPNDVLGAGLGRKKRQDARAAAHVKHHLA
jgi:hypothetical protein